MISLLLIYFVGKAFYDLAHKYKKSEWGFAILGVVSYYFGIIMCSFILGFITAFTGSDFVATTPRIVLGLLSIPIGIFSCWGLYSILKSEWRKNPAPLKNDTLDGDLINRS